VAGCGNASADVSQFPPDVSVDGDTEVSVSSALEISEDEHEDADDDDSDDGTSISSETKRLMGNDPFKGVCLYKPERKVMDLPLAIIGKESDGWCIFLTNSLFILLWISTCASYNDFGVFC
jgi:hypothetical protein